MGQRGIAYLEHRINGIKIIGEATFEYYHDKRLIEFELCTKGRYKAFSQEVLELFHSEIANAIASALNKNISLPSDCLYRGSAECQIIWSRK